MSDVSSAPARRGIHVPTWVFITVGGVLIFLIAFAIGRRSERRHFDGGRFGEHAGRNGLGILILIVIVALVITGIVLAVRHFGGGGGGGNRAASASSGTRDAENLLAQRLARGEIDEAEYRSRLDTLRG